MFMMGRNTMSETKRQTLFLLLAALFLSSCDDTPSDGEAALAPATEAAGFEAVITGAYEGKASGSGVLQFLPAAGFERQGYYFLADGQGIRPHGVTFVLPGGIGPGIYRLESPSPFDIGSVPSVRVDRDMGDAVVSADQRTSGFVELTGFPDDAAGLAEASVTGNFEFETENVDSEKITVSGVFSFKAR